jgi:hypothetical protein
MSAQICKVDAGLARIQAAGKGAVVLLRDITQNAERAKDALIKLGDVQGSFSTNVGGNRADALRKDINNIARDKKFGPEGRDALIQTATTATDLDPGLSNKRILNTVSETATLSRATGFDPKKAFEAANSMSANMNMSFNRAVDQAAVLGTSGFSAGSIKQIAERFGGLEGKDVTTMLMAARENMSPAGITEGLNTLRNAMTRRNDQGQLVQELRDLGLSGDQSFVEQIRTIRKGMKSGDINTADLEKLGGTRAQGVLKAFTSAVPNLDEARRSLESTTAEDLVQKKRESEVVRASERASERELRTQLAREQSGMGGTAEKISEEQTQLQERGDGSLGLAVVKSSVSGRSQMEGAPRSAEALEDERQRNAANIPFGPQQLQSFGEKAIQRVRSNIEQRLQKLTERGEITQKRAASALGQFNAVADDQDTTVHQAIVQAEAGIGPDNRDVELQKTIVDTLRGSRGSGSGSDATDQADSRQQPATGSEREPTGGDQPSQDDPNTEAQMSRASHPRPRR